MYLIIYYILIMPEGADDDHDFFRSHTPGHKSSHRQLNWELTRDMKSREEEDGGAEECTDFQEFLGGPERGAAAERMKDPTKPQRDKREIPPYIPECNIYTHTHIKHIEECERIQINYERCKLYYN